MMFGSDVLEAIKTDEGVHLSNYWCTEQWSEDAKEYVENRAYSREFDAGQDVYEQIVRLAEECNMTGWNNFHGANPPGVLDGTSFSFEAVLEDGTTILASGSNNFPQNYGTFTKGFRTLIVTTDVTSTAFANQGYKLTLPESWIGQVRIRFWTDGCAFYIPVHDREVSIMMVDSTTYDYAENVQDAIRLGILEKVDEERRYLDIRPGSPGKEWKEGMNVEQKAILEGIHVDMQAIAESAEGVDGYVLTKR